MSLILYYKNWIFKSCLVAFQSVLFVWENLKFLFAFLVSIFIGVTYLLRVSAYIFRFHSITFKSDDKIDSSDWNSPIYLSSTFSYCIAMSISSSSTVYIYQSPYFWYPSTLNNLPCLVLHGGTPHPGLPRSVCRAICRNGQQCRNSAFLGSDVCRRHTFESSFRQYWKLLKVLPYSRCSNTGTNDACPAILSEVPVTTSEIHNWADTHTGHFLSAFSD
jgi:hypothetical protein